MNKRFQIISTEKFREDSISAKVKVGKHTYNMTYSPANDLWIGGAVEAEAVLPYDITEEISIELERILFPNSYKEIEAEM